MSYIIDHPDIVWGLLLDHLKITLLALVIAVLIAVPLGLLITRVRPLATPIMGVLGILYTVPSLALIILLLPLLGLDARPVIVALVIYSQVIIVRNVVAGLAAIPPAVLEAATGMGMSGWQRWWRVELPLALPIILAGVRIAAVVTVAIATIGAKFAAGGLGTLLFEGIAEGRYDKIWAGAITVSALALAANWLLLFAERAFDPVIRASRRRVIQANREAFEGAQPTHI